MADEMTGVSMAPAREPRTEGQNQGLYDSRYEHDACGVGFVADLGGEPRHDTVAKALTVLRNLDHRGAKGADPESGDGAGIVTQMPDELLRAVAPFALPPAGGYAAGLAFLPSWPSRQATLAAVERIAADEGLAVLGWRAVPHNPGRRGAGAREVLPELAQLFVAGLAGETGMALDRRAYCLRKRAEHETGLQVASLSCATIVYKGMLTAPQLEDFFPDLADARYLGPRAGALPVLHQHVSVLAAGPPVPARRAQRRDQHDSGQPELDAGPGGSLASAVRRTAPGRGIERAAVLDATAATRPASTPAWNCCTWAGGRCRTRC